MNVSEVIARRLKEAGVERVYGLPGGENVFVLEALRQEGIQFVLVHNEASAVFMADAEARLTGRPGVCLTTLGPGITNAMAGISHAYLDRSPVIILTARMFADWSETHTHQTIDQIAMMMPVTKATIDVTPDNVGEAIASALTLTMAGRPGPVHLQISKQVAQESADFSKSGLRQAQPSSKINEDQLAIVKEKLGEANRPILLLGLGLEPQAPYAAIQTLAESIGAPVITTPKGKGALSADHPLAAGTLGIMRTDPPYELLAESDLIIGIGFDVVELVKPWDEEAPFVWIAPWENEDPKLPAIAELVGDMEPILLALSDGVFATEDGWGETRVKQFWQTTKGDTLPQPVADRLSPQTVIQAIRNASPTDALVTTDVGSHKIMTALTWSALAPNRYMLSNGMSSMGFGLPAAIAASLVLGEPTIAIMGDGGFSMIVGELELITRLNTPVIIVVMNDNALDLIRAAQTRVGHDPFGTEFGNPDFVKIAEAYGIDGVRVNSEEAVFNSVKEAYERRQTVLIEALIDPASYPTTPRREI